MAQLLIHWIILSWKNSHLSFYHSCWVTDLTRTDWTIFFLLSRRLKKTKILKGFIYRQTHYRILFYDCFRVRSRHDAKQRYHAGAKNNKYNERFLEIYTCHGDRYHFVKYCIIYNQHGNVVGIGEKKAPKELRDACSEFFENNGTSIKVLVICNFPFSF